MTQVDLLATHYYSHKIVCVAPYSTDTLLLINIPKTMLEKVIKVMMMISMIQNIIRLLAPDLSRVNHIYKMKP